MGDLGREKSGRHLSEILTVLSAVGSHLAASWAIGPGGVLEVAQTPLASSLQRQNRMLQKGEVTFPSSPGS